MFTSLIYACMLLRRYIHVAITTILITHMSISYMPPITNIAKYLFNFRISLSTLSVSAGRRRCVLCGVMLILPMRSSWIYVLHAPQCVYVAVLRRHAAAAELLASHSSIACC
jgi:hypothetical protein